ncbi:hypothetical protein C0J52_25936 [Blattella germanica]|nr:hypothetical protein C0J52_25936 [Blattella germanica]
MTSYPSAKNQFPNFYSFLKYLTFSVKNKNSTACYCSGGNFTFCVTRLVYTAPCRCLLFLIGIH